MSSPTKYLKGECTHCGGHLEFPAEAAGLATECPHCGQQTDLLLATPPDDSGIPKSVIIWTAVAVLLLLGGLGGALYALKRAQRWAETKKPPVEVAQPNVPPSAPSSPAPPPDPISQAGFRVSDVTLDKTQGTSLTYAVGTLDNLSNKTRYGVKLQFDVLDPDGKKIGTTSDYKDVIDPNGKWNFRALVVEGKAASAKAAAVTEQQ